jgi:hypothetical protein
MKKFIWFLIFSFIVAACGNNQQKQNPIQPAKSEPKKTVQAQPTPVSELGMWKIASYAGDLGDNKNASYITNSLAVWGTYRNGSVENSEVKVKFLIDKVSFCIKLYEYGKKVVKKGDESGYKITVKTADSEPLLISAKNVSDRIFIAETDSKKIIEFFSKGSSITFSMVSDSKTNPSSYCFMIDNAAGFDNAMKKLSN